MEHIIEETTCLSGNKSYHMILSSIINVKGGYQIIVSWIRYALLLGIIIYIVICNYTWVTTSVFKFCILIVFINTTLFMLVACSIYLGINWIICIFIEVSKTFTKLRVNCLNIIRTTRICSISYYGKYGIHKSNKEWHNFITMWTLVHYFLQEKTKIDFDWYHNNSACLKLSTLLG